MTADVIDLVDHHRAVAVALVCDATEVRDDRVVLVAEVAAGQHPGSVRRRRRDDDHRRAATGAFAIIAEVAVDGQATLAHVGGVCAKHDAVLERLMAQFDGREQVRKLLRHGDLTPCHCADFKSRAAPLGTDYATQMPCHATPTIT